MSNKLSRRSFIKAGLITAGAVADRRGPTPALCQGCRKLRNGAPCWIFNNASPAVPV
jgi:hypothetical protein